MKTLVVYYSITGNTRQIAEEVASELGADIEELHDPRIRKGLPGYLRLAADTIRKVEATLAPATYDPGSYDMVVLAGPIWSSKICSPTLVYGREHKDQFRKAAVLCTSRSSEPGYAKKCLATLTTATGIAPVAMLGLGHTEIRGDHTAEVAKFVAALKNSTTTTVDEEEQT